MKNILLLLLLMSQGCWASEILYYEGDAYIISTGGERTKVSYIGQKIQLGESVITKAKSRVVLSAKGKKSVLAEDSALHIRKQGFWGQLKGRIYYVFEKYGLASKQRKIFTPVATIGVRGTNFLVEVDDSAGSVYLLSGLVSLEPLEGNDFSVKKYPLGMSFQDFQAEQDKLFSEFNDANDFESYQRQQMQDFGRFKKQVMLQPGQVADLSSSGEVDIQQNKGDTSKDATSFEALLERIAAGEFDVNE